MKIRTFFNGLLIIGMAIASSACDKEDVKIEQSGGNSSESSGESSSYKIYFSPLQENEWSSQPYYGVHVARIATDIANPSLEYTAPDGYDLYLVSTDKTNSDGLPVYWITADFPTIPTTTINNEWEDVELTINIKGAKNQDNKNIKVNFSKTINLKRYYCPVTTEEQLAKDWYLLTYTKYLFDFWGTSPGGISVEGMYSDKVTYPKDKTPIKFDVETLGDNSRWMTYSNSETGLAGWKDNCTDISVQPVLTDGVLNTSAEPYPGVYYISDTELKCIASQYENGILTANYVYTFIVDK